MMYVPLRSLSLTLHGEREKQSDHSWFTSHTTHSKSSQSKPADSVVPAQLGLEAPALAWPEVALAYSNTKIGRAHV